MKKISLIGFALILASLTSCASEVNPVQVVDNTVQQSAAKKQEKYTNFQSYFFMAQSKARNWDFSANLVRAESRWVSEDGVGNWTFYFKSPFKNRAYRVDMGFGEEVPNMFFGREIFESSIRVDVDKAIEAAKKQGLSKFPISEMVLEKSSINVEWTIRSSSGTYRINAER